MFAYRPGLGGLLALVGNEWSWVGSEMKGDWKVLRCCRSVAVDLEED